MITPVPARVDNSKDAAMWSVLNALEQIDNNTTSRASFAQSILFNIATQLDGPVFKEEIRQLREQLGVKIEEAAPSCSTPENTVSEDRVPREELVLRDL